MKKEGDVVYAITSPTSGDWRIREGDEEAPYIMHFRLKQKKGHFGYIDNKEVMTLQTLPMTNTQLLNFKTKLVFCKTLLEDFVCSFTMHLQNMWAYKNR